MKDKKRESERFDYPKTIDYCVEPCASEGVLKGVAINISQNGLCIYSFVPHARGQQLVIKSPLPVDHSKATVRWIQKEDDSMYRVGLGFDIDSSDGQRKKTNA